MAKLPLRLQTYRAIRDGILSNRYHPGVPLSEQQLADELQVSRTPVREAVKQLEHEGLVSVVPLRGIFPRKVTVRDVVEIFQIREALECFAIRISDFTVGDERLRALDQLFERFESSVAVSPEDKDCLFEADTALHRMIVEAAGNGRMIKTLEPLRTQILRVRSLSWAEPSRVIDASREHRCIVQALLQNDRVGAEAALSDHLRLGRNHLLRYMVFADPRSEENAIFQED